MIAHAPLVSRANALGNRKQDSDDRDTKDHGVVLSLYELHTAVPIHPLRTRDAMNFKNHMDNLFSGHSGVQSFVSIETLLNVSYYHYKFL
jgi:hypothetical protein